MFNIGDYVRIQNNNLCGVIIKKNNNYCYIKTNDKIVKVKENLIESISKDEYINSQISTTNEKARNVYSHLVEKTLSNEIMLRHQTVETAIQNLDKFIDTAILNNIEYVKIIHGKNGGVLRNAVHEYLKNSPYVKSFRLGDYYEGQFGVTIAKLK